MRFKDSQKKEIESASREAIVASLSAWAAGPCSNEWLRHANRYKKLAPKNFLKDSKGSNINCSDLVDYVACSAPLHLIDGWSFFGRSIDSLLRGDNYSAIHFAYYAELRAAMSLLGSEGIGIFNNHHAIIKSKTEVLCFPDNSNSIGTHVMAAQALDHWCTSDRAVDLINNTITPEGISLSAWIEGVVTGKVYSSVIAKSWFTKWGFDLFLNGKDRGNRNIVSYSPSEFDLSCDLPLNELKKFISEIWEVFEPGGGRGFSKLDQYLLRSALRLNKKKIKKKNLARIEGQIHSLGLGLNKSKQWAKFLVDRDELIFLKEAASNETELKDHYVKKIISRAVLLLHISTRTIAKLLSDASCTGQRLDFWWQRVAVSRGIWGEGSIPDDPSDAWNDIKDCINCIQASNSDSLCSFRQDKAREIGILGAWELVGIWGLISSE